MGVAIITPTAGLMPCDTPIGIAQLRGFSRVPISIKNQRYRTSLCRAAHGFADQIGPACEVVLLGSIASTKYLSLLLPIFGERLRVPARIYRTWRHEPRRPIAALCARAARARLYCRLLHPGGTRTEAASDPQTFIAKRIMSPLRRNQS